ncbi:hypothetical protein HOY82DRAFT_549897 [Tuber indicum]|nr:hypothetical protein HOY82DRAFT_549897 [Tuber indicum]
MPPLITDSTLVCLLEFPQSSYPILLLIAVHTIPYGRIAYHRYYHTNTQYCALCCTVLYSSMIFIVFENLQS